jgi:hypothetical protein
LRPGASHDQNAMVRKSVVGFVGALRRVGRPLLGIIVAYAVAAQSLFIALGGFGLPVAADALAPGFELCVHDGGAPDLPVGAPPSPSHPACSHCIFCFAGSHHALAAPPSALFHNVSAEFISVAWLSVPQTKPRLSAYSIANPRGPPSGA